MPCFVYCLNHFRSSKRRKKFRTLLHVRKFENDDYRDRFIVLPYDITIRRTFVQKVYLLIFDITDILVK